MASELYAIRTALKSGANGLVAGGFTLTAARTVLGYDELAANNTFLGDLITDGPYLLIGDGELVGRSALDRTALYRVNCHLYFGIARDADNDFTNILTFLAALKNQATWLETDLSWSRAKIAVLKAPAIVHYEITAEVRGT